VKLGWDSAKFASYYDVYFGTSATPPLVGDNISATSYQVSVDNFQLYYWTVCAINNNGQTCTLSGTWSFTVGLGAKSSNVQIPVEGTNILTGTMASTIQRFFTSPMIRSGPETTGKLYPPTWGGDDLETKIIYDPEALDSSKRLVPPPGPLIRTDRDK